MHLINHVSWFGGGLNLGARGEDGIGIERKRGIRVEEKNGEGIERKKGYRGRLSLLVSFNYII